MSNTSQIDKFIIYFIRAMQYLATKIVDVDFIWYDQMIIYKKIRWYHIDIRNQRWVVEKRRRRKRKVSHEQGILQQSNPDMLIGM